MNHIINALEEQRSELQDTLDALKIQSERNRLGQFATPITLAIDILKYASTVFPENDQVRFLDPAIGTGVFYSALQTVFTRQRVIEALGFEIDAHYEGPASRLWANSSLKIKLADFTRQAPSPRFNLVICNPPYVRHHHLHNNDKIRLQTCTYHASGMKLNGLGGLYCHFLGLSHAWMADNGIAGWLIPSEFMDVNYGQVVKRYLLNKVTLLHIHRFAPNDVQFKDALVSSAVVWFKKSPPPKNHTVRFTLGGTLLAPALSRNVSTSDLAREHKWTRFPAANIRGERSVQTLSDFFQIKRGVATGDNRFFILDTKSILSRGLPLELFRPILPSPRFLPEDEVFADENGIPLIDRRLFLLDTKLSEDRINECYPALFAYLQDGRASGIQKRYLCQHRVPWYAQENRPPAPIVCTYLGRGNKKHGKPFRFILNSSIATVANVYLAMYPTPILERAMKADPTLLRRVWTVLNQLPLDRLFSECRVYGGGLYKLEPSELATVEATEIANLIPALRIRPTGYQLGLFAEDRDSNKGM